MGTSFVSINGNGFWMRDSVLELFLRFAALHIEDAVEDGSVAHRIRDGWLLASRGYFGGCVPIDLDAAVATSGGKAIVIDAITSLRAALQKGAPRICHHAINLMGISGDYCADVETARLLEVSDAFLSLIHGAPFGDAGCNVPMPGSLVPRHGS